jgi:hypothetical protein
VLVERPSVCEAPEEDLFAATLSILGGVFHLVSPADLDDLVMPYFSEIEGLDAGLAEENCLVPMHAICVLLLTPPTQPHVKSIKPVPPSPSGSVTTSVTSSSGSVAKSKDIKRTARDLEDNFVKLFRYLFPTLSRDRLPNADRIRAVVDEVAATCRTSLEVSVRACEAAYDCLQTMSQLDVKAEKGGADKKKCVHDIYSPFFNHVSVLAKLFPYLSGAEIKNSLFELLRVTAKLGVSLELREVPIGVLCDMLDRRLKLH